MKMAVYAGKMARWTAVGIIGTTYNGARQNSTVARRCQTAAELLVIAT